MLRLAQLNPSLLYLFFAVTPGENIESLTHITDKDMDRHFKQNDTVDNLLAVPGLDALTNVRDDDMEKMMFVSKEMLGCELAQGDLDNLLNTNTFTSKMIIEKKVLAKMTDVPNVSKLTRVLFKDLKKMTDVKSVENLTKLEKSHLKDSVAIKWVREDQV